MKDVLDFFFLSKAPKWKKRRKQISNKGYDVSNLTHEVEVRLKSFGIKRIRVHLGLLWLCLTQILYHKTRKRA